MKKILLIPVFALVFGFTPVFAQDTAGIEEGIVAEVETSIETETTTVRPANALIRFFENVGTFFIFGDSAKSERYLKLAEKRLAEAEILADSGDERARVAIQRYEAQLVKAKERAEQVGEFDLEAKIEEATTRHLRVLDMVLERVPEQAKSAIEAVKQRTLNRQVEGLRALMERNPERGLEIYERATEARTRAIEARADRLENNEEKPIKELERYQKTLSEVRERVPEEARINIDRVMNRQVPQKMERPVSPEIRRPVPTRPQLTERTRIAEESTSETETETVETEVETQR